MFQILISLPSLFFSLLFECVCFLVYYDYCSISFVVYPPALIVVWFCVFLLTFPCRSPADDIPDGDFPPCLQRRLSPFEIRWLCSSASTMIFPDESTANFCRILSEINALAVVVTWSGMFRVATAAPAGRASGDGLRGMVCDVIDNVLRALVKQMNCLFSD